MKTVHLPDGEEIPALGMRTWMIGDDPAQESEEIATLQEGIDLGLRLIDTTEMYGEGNSEKMHWQSPSRTPRQGVFSQ